MDHLWSPWRFTYVTRARPGDACIFCEIARSQADEENYVVHRAQHNLIVLNRYPYTSGHLMIAPYEHVATLSDAPEAATLEMMRLARDAERHLGAVYRPAGLNIGMNVGECAGAGVAGHIHLHVLPRWPGDSNFMTVIGETRVAVEDLATTWEKLSRAFQAK